MLRLEVRTTKPSDVDPSLLGRIARSSAFESLVVVVTFFATSVMIAETYLPSQSDLFAELNYGVVAFFILEISLKIAHERTAFFTSPGRLFDLTLVLLSLVTDVLFNAIPQVNVTFRASFFRLLRFLRLPRLLRVFTTWTTLRVLVSTYVRVLRPLADLLVTIFALT